MKPEQVEDMRYQKGDNCEIMLEEKIMFQALERWRKRAKKELSDIDILDLGCGSGKITRKIKNLGYQAKGLDFSKEATKKAVANGIDAKLCNLDEGISEIDGTYDIIWAGDIIEHVFDPISLIGEISRVLKKDGMLIMSIPSDVGLFTRIKTLLGISHQTITYKKHGYYKHHTFFTLALAKYMLLKNSFKICEVHKILSTGRKRYSFVWLPSFFYNELVIVASK